jgi:hypothetical protein
MIGNFQEKKPLRQVVVSGKILLKICFGRVGSECVKSSEFSEERNLIESLRNEVNALRNTSTEIGYLITS